MKTSAAGRAAIEQLEGKRLRAYRDSKGIWTIGVGHARTLFGHPITAETTITDAQCDALLAADLAGVEAELNCVVHVPMTQNQFDALVSLGFNIGESGEAHSTVVRLLNAGDVRGAADAFLLWNHPAELTGRREAERAQFLAADGASVERVIVAPTPVSAPMKRPATPAHHASAPARRVHELGPPAAPPRLLSGLAAALGSLFRGA